MDKFTIFELIKQNFEFSLHAYSGLYLYFTKKDDTTYFYKKYKYNELISSDVINIENIFLLLNEYEYIIINNKEYNLKSGKYLSNVY